MSNAITIHGTVQTRTNGIATDLRCVVAGGRDVCARLMRKRPGKQLHPAHRPHAMAYADMPAPAALLSSSPPRMSSAAWRPPMEAAAEAALPPAAWASFVITQAMSA